MPETKKAFQTGKQIPPTAGKNQKSNKQARLIREGFEGGEAQVTAGLRRGGDRCVAGWKGRKVQGHLVDS